MLQFPKKTGGNPTERRINPIEIYDSLDRASDKGPLRLSQSSVLIDWYNNYREKKDVIVKLHTGQGKTLIGLLILQSKLNSDKKPVLYVCPNKLLVEQTCEQAKQFGFKYCTVDKNNQLPQEFIDAKSILIVHVQLLFNGLTKFGLRHKAIDIHSMVLDDSHACIDTIQDAFTIVIKRSEPLYNDFFNLFEQDLEEQGQATIEEIRQEKFDAFLPVPFWAWFDKIDRVISLLVKNNDKDYIKFAWELIKDIIAECQCIISGSQIEIFNYQNPIELFGSFHKCQHRIFMSATTSNDAFFVKALGLSIEVVKHPLKYKDESWSGEKLILIPYLMHEDLTHVTVVNRLAPPSEKRKYGVVALVPSVKGSKFWTDLGSILPDSTNIQSRIKELKEGEYKNTIVLANRYDGIDLPDDACRVLILDGKPFAISLSDRLQELYRENSKVIDVKIAQKIEQGLGRAVRGEKDYCVVIITGNDLIATLRTKRLKRYFSDQTNKQIDIGLEIGKLAINQDETNDGVAILTELLRMSISRDEQWKEYYTNQMNDIQHTEQDYDLLDILAYEKQAENFCRNGMYKRAIETIQEILDKFISVDNHVDKAFYLQEMARYAYRYQKTLSNDYQISAYKANRILLKPLHGIEFQKLQINQHRSENIINWIRQYDNYSELMLRFKEIYDNLSFGTNADKFERSLNDLGICLGFACERPDKEQKKGPDNLWNIEKNQYILFECKNEVDQDRNEITKSESGQMNNSCAWFKSNYKGASVKNVMVIPTKNISAAAGFVESVEVLRKGKLNNLRNNTKLFFEEFKDYDLKNITELQINKSLATHHLTITDILNEYFETPVQRK